jgi:hypothetical protein
LISHHRHKERLSVADAAKLLDITPEAIRQHIRRGPIQYEKGESGKYYVYVLGLPRLHGLFAFKPQHLLSF